MVEIHKIKITLTINKRAHIRICILELSKVPMYEFHFDYIKNEYGNKSRLLFAGTNSLMYELETDNDYDDFNKNTEMFDFCSCSSKSKYYDDSKALVAGKIAR